MILMLDKIELLKINKIYVWTTKIGGHFLINIEISLN